MLREIIIGSVEPEAPFLSIKTLKPFELAINTIYSSAQADVCSLNKSLRTAKADCHAILW